MAYAVMGRLPWVWLRSVGDNAALLYAEGIAALVVQYLHRALRRKEVLVVPGRQGAALFHLEQRPLAAALTAAADTHGDGGDHIPRACCSSAALSIGGKSLPRRSARRKIP